MWKYIIINDNNVKIIICMKWNNNIINENNIIINNDM